MASEDSEQSIKVIFVLLWCFFVIFGTFCSKHPAKCPFLCSPDQRKSNKFGTSWIWV